MFDIKLIKPKNIKTSDKYSTNLYKFVKKKRFAHVYFNKKSCWDGKELKLNWNEILPSQIFIGSNMIDEFYEDINIGCFIGKSLARIISGNKLYDCGAYCGFGGFYPKRDFIDITEEFWKRYIKIGRCLFLNHDAWCIGQDKRFTYVNNTRKCNWCGKWQKKQIEKETEIKRVVKWRD